MRLQSRPSMPELDDRFVEWLRRKDGYSPSSAGAPRMEARLLTMHADGHSTRRVCSRP